MFTFFNHSLHAPTIPGKPRKNRNLIKNTAAPREGIFCLLLLFMHAKRVEDSRAIDSRGPGGEKGF